MGAETEKSLRARIDELTDQVTKLTRENTRLKERVSDLKDMMEDPPIVSAIQTFCAEFDRFFDREMGSIQELKEALEDLKGVAEL